MEPNRPRLFISADAPEALVRVCGVTMLDRLLRTLQRAGFDHATVLTTTPGVIERELANPSWARGSIEAETRIWDQSSLMFDRQDNAVDGHGFFLISGGSYFDPRLIDAILACRESTALVDCDPAQPASSHLGVVRKTRRGHVCGAFLFRAEFDHSQPVSRNLFDHLAEQIDAEKLATLEVGALPTFIVSMRRDLRPLWFPAPNQSMRSAAEEIVLDTAQKGTGEMTSYLEKPFQDWIMRRLWNTTVTPLHITFFGLGVGIVATVAFLNGYLWTGALLALSIGVIDGLDGKQARVKVETTKLGRWEGEMDYPVQMSWWIALAYHFTHAYPGSHAVRWVIVFLVADIVDKLFTRWVKQTTGRYIENYSRIDRFVRLFASQRSLYVCMLIGGLIVGQPYGALVLIASWHLAIACVHGVRAVWISRDRRSIGPIGK